MIKTLITNDDGIHSNSLHILAREFSKIGEVVVIAPDSEKSGSSHSITIHKHITVTKEEEDGNCKKIAISGTPVDCVKFGIQEHGKFDMVVSGINIGPNVGCHLLYSGTVSAALEGAMYALPSLAFSMDNACGRADLQYAAEFARRLAEKILKEPLIPGSALNINFPDIPRKEIRGLKITRQSYFRFDDSFIKAEEGYKLMGNIPDHTPEDNSDVFALKMGFISLTPIHTDLTNHNLYHNLNSFEI